MAKKDKWGSPFDPRNGGKVEKPREERQPFSIRGCGDPNCPGCNPESAAANLGSRGMPFRFGGGGIFNLAPSADEALSEYSRRLEEMKRQLYGQQFYSVDLESDNYSKETPRTPPASYNAARKDVEKWIIKAPEQNFEDIVGNDEALEQLRDAIRAPITHKELYEAYGLKMPKGALLSGPPGCGKTMFARAAASEMRKLYGDSTEFVCVSGSELQSPYIGVTEGYIKGIFTFAREYKSYHGYPLLVFMDEADVFLPDRTGRVRRVSSWEESQVATFLAEMDGIQESGAFMLLASNRPETIDQAVLRDGRCDFKITVKMPTVEAIQKILEKNFINVPLNKDFTLESLVFSAIESLMDPHKIIVDAQAFKLRLKEEGIGIDLDIRTRHFLLEHIISGAMAASIPARAKRIAFNRDKEGGTITGVRDEDVVKAVNILFEENKKLDHGFALNEFQQQFIDELNETEKNKESKKGMH